MQLGTAKINEAQSAQGHRYFIVRWMNHGSFLTNEPRGFRTIDEAREFCRGHGLRIV